MTNSKVPTAYDWGRNIDPFTTVGLDKLFERLGAFNDFGTPTKYPPYNLLREGDNTYRIEMAIAGFTEDEIDITVKQNLLTITASAKTEETADESKYLHRGIATREFVRKFTLADTVEVKNAALRNGVLTIVLENIVPEAQKERKIAIARQEPQLLNG